MSSSTVNLTVPTRSVVHFRPLTPTEAGLVMDEITRSTTISGYSFDEWTRTRATAVALDPATGELLGAVLVHHLAWRWSEIAVVYVLPDHRGHGIGHALVTAAVERLRAADRRVLMLFCEEPMRRLAQQVGFRVHDDERAFARSSWRHHLFIRGLYPLQWLADGYRRRELRRKREELGCSFTFSVAVID